MLKIIQQTTNEPLSVDEIKNWLRISPSDTADDTDLGTLITAAREAIEQYTRTAIVTTTFEYTAPSGNYLELPRPPLVAATKVEIIRDGVTSEMDASMYRVDPVTEPARLYLKQYPHADYVKVTYTAGYTNIPKGLLIAIKQLAGYWYKQGRQSGGEIPAYIKEMLDPYRVYTIGGY